MRPAVAPDRTLPPINELATGGPVVLYDGVCGLCNGFVKFALRWDRNGTLRFATLQGRYGEAARHHAPYLSGIDSIVFVHGKEFAVKSLAVARALRQMGGLGRLGWLILLFPRPIRDFVYDAVARVRYRWFGRFDACPIPPADVRERFLD